MTCEQGTVTDRPAGASAPRGHVQRVRRYFDEPQRYLSGDVRLRIRRLVCRMLTETVDRSAMLDLGCGDGTMSLPLLPPGGRLTLVDFSAGMLQRAEANVPPQLRADVEVVQADLMEFEAPAPYTLVLCLGVLAHVPDVGRALEKIVSLVRPGGHCLLQITDASRLLGRINYAWYDWRSRVRRSDAYALNRLESGKLIGAAEALGLRLAGRRSYSLTFPGLRRLPDAAQFRLERSFLNSRLSRFGGESLLLFRRP